MAAGPASSNDDRRRASVRRTVIVLAVIATAIYGAFILSGVIGR